MSTPKYRKHSNRDYAFVEFQGRRFPLPGQYESGESRRAYNEFVSRYVFGNESPTDKLTDFSVSEICLLFDSYAGEHYPNGRRSSYANLARTAVLLNSYAGSIPATDFGPLKLKAFRQTLIDAGQSRNYINQIVGQVKRIFKWASSEELVDVSTYQSLCTVDGLRKNRSGARETKPRRPVSWADVEPVFSHINEVVSSMLWLQWFTGARSHSICQASNGQFDKESEPELWLWKPRHKTEESNPDLLLPIGPKCQEKLRAIFDSHTGEYLFNPRDTKRGKNQRYRNHYDTDSYRQAVQRGQKAAGVDRWFPHQLRHARGTLVRNKHGIEAAQAILGHERLETSQIYAKRQLDLAIKVARGDG